MYIWIYMGCIYVWIWRCFATHQLMAKADLVVKTASVHHSQHHYTSLNSVQDVFFIFCPIFFQVLKENINLKVVQHEPFLKLDRLELREALWDSHQDTNVEISHISARLRMNASGYRFTWFTRYDSNITKFIFSDKWLGVAYCLRLAPFQPTASQWSWHDCIEKPDHAMSNNNLECLLVTTQSCGVPKIIF